MSLSSFTSAKFGGALVGAFLGGLVVASAFDRTPFGYAQPSAPLTQSATRTAATAPVAPASVAELNVAFTSIAETVTPAVVSIQAERSARQIQQQQQQRPPRRNQPPTLEDFFGQFGNPQQQAPRQASGSGFIVSKDGYILTNNHVVDDFDRVHVTLTDQRTFDARVVGRDPTTDVAVIKIDAGNNLPVAALGNDDAVKIGEWVLAIGNPLGLDFTVTAGIVSAKGRGSRDIGPSPNQNNYAISDFIQTDAAINPGNSGGPLVNIRGQVIGINSMIASQTGYFSGYGFAIPITLAKDVMDDIITHGRVRRAMLGVSITDASAEDAAAAGLKNITGVLVQDYPADVDSPAKRAGLEPGDVIVKADGKDTPRVSTLQRIIRSHEPGEVVDVEAMRFGQRKTFKVKLGEVEENPTRTVANSSRNDSVEKGGGTVSSRIGVTVEPVTAEQARANEIPDDRRGLRVSDVKDDGPARNKLGEDDILVAVINPTHSVLRTAQDLTSAVARAADGGTGYISLQVYNVSFKTTRIVTLRLGNQR